MSLLLMRSKPPPKTLFSSLVALAATSEPKPAPPPSNLRNIVITTHPTLRAYTVSRTSTTNNTTFTVQTPSSALLDLLANAPASFSFSDQIRYPKLEDGKPGTIKQAGKPRFQLGIWLDDLPE
ncbi:MAG: hypothetical protein LQ352_007208, partial [Teloschistes flavicans]